MITVIENIVFAIGTMIIAGFFGGTIAARLKFPRITGYIAVGILLSPSVLNLMHDSMLEATEIVSIIALSVIAYVIGGSLRLQSIRKQAKDIFWITPFQCLLPWLLTTVVIMLLAPFILNIPDATLHNTYFPMAFVLGAIAVPTAPIIIVAILHEYKARGTLSTTLLAVVALTDAFAIVAFSFATGIAEPLVHGSEGFPLYQMLVSPLIHIAESVGIGIVFGFALAYFSRFIRRRTFLLVVILGMIVLSAGVAELRNASPLLANMVLAFVAVNRTRRKELLYVIDEVEEMIFIIFFVLSGMHFNLGAVKSAGLLTLLIIISRDAGKYFGATVGARISGAPDVVSKYLGLALLPKAGLVIGLAFLAEGAFPTFGSVLFNGVFASVVINTLVTPFLARYAIFKAGEQRMRS